MVRTFCTNQIRNTEELSGSVWSFVPESGRACRNILFCCGTYSLGKSSGICLLQRAWVFSQKILRRGKCASCVQRNQPYSRDLFRWPPSLENTIMRIRHFHFWQDRFRAGEHELKIIVDNRFSENSALHIPNDYMTYGGTNRGIVLEHLKKAYIDISM